MKRRDTDSRELAVRYCDDPSCGCGMAESRATDPSPLTPQELTEQIDSCPKGPSGNGGRHNMTWRKRKAGTGFYCDYCGLSENSPLTPDEISAQLEDMQSGERDIRALNATIKALRAERDEALALLGQSRIALTFYAAWMLDERDDRVTYPFGQDCERNIRSTLSRLSWGAR